MFSLFKNKIFCISFQRTGTTSTGQFFKDHNFKVATFSVSKSNKWTHLWIKKEYHKIFWSLDFLVHQVFEDDPWWCNDFYKELYYRYPKSKFILLERDANKWFDSMISHSKGKNLGNTYIHSILYNRLDEFRTLNIDKDKWFDKDIRNLLPLNENHRQHYINIYKTRNEEVKKFFTTNDSTRLFTGKLEDKMVWKKMAFYFSIDISSDYNVHSNASKEK